MSQKTMYILSENEPANAQMVEGFAREYLDINQWTIRSGSTENYNLHPLAMEVMDEIGIDISNQRSHLLDTSLLPHTDFVISLSRDVQANFNELSEDVRFKNWGFENSERVEGTEEEKLVAFRRVRDAIINRMEEFSKVEG